MKRDCHPHAEDPAVATTGSETPFPYSLDDGLAEGRFRRIEDGDIPRLAIAIDPATHPGRAFADHSLGIFRAHGANGDGQRHSCRQVTDTRALV